MMDGLMSFSDILGYTSIACWLGAQFPQVMENIRNQSSEGLALPFLANWALGDLSNLIGCILTHQLPFQTTLAVYFCFVDFTLVGQYLYYRGNVKPRPLYGHQRTRTTSSTIRRTSVDRGAPRYRTLSGIAANIATTAALAAHQDEQADARYNTRSRRWRASTEQLAEESGSRISRQPNDEVDESALAALAESFHSEGGRTSRRLQVSWSRERHRERVSRDPRSAKSIFFPPQPLMTVDQTDPLNRGRPLQRDGDQDTEGWERTRTTSESANKTTSRASRKGASMVFLSIWALFGIGSLTGSTSDRTSLGRVLAVDPIRISDVSGFAPAAVTSESMPPPPSDFHFQTLNASGQYSAEDKRPSRERLVGRIFAWLCTTLYLTSRLPQIWKNYVRKSVDGLSMYMFVFAFLGNSFYVASILFSPEFLASPPASTTYIRESIPYLLGSGGTLCFDITIVLQSFIYRAKGQNRGRRSSIRQRIVEEEAGLLSSDVLAGSVESFSKKGRTSTSGIRNPA